MFSLIGKRRRREGEYIYTLSDAIDGSESVVNDVIVQGGCGKAGVE